MAPGVAAAGDAGTLVLLARILLLQPILLGASNILANLTQMRHRFVLYSISPLLYNLGIIIGVVWFYPMWGLAGLGWGVVLGALLHACIQLPYYASEPRIHKVSWKESWAALKQVLKLSVPRTLSLAANQISLVVLTALASFLAAGSITIFTFAWNLQAVPLTIIGVSYSVAAFPTLARVFASSGRSSEFLKHIEVALRHVIFWTLPATVFIIVLRAQLVRAILGSGAFSWDATRLTAAALALLIISLLAQSVSLLIARAYYAAGESKKPFYFGVIDVIISVTTALLLVGAFHSSTFWRYFLESLFRVTDVPGTTVLMLALAMALGSIAEFVVGFWYMKRDFKMELKGLGRLSFQSFAASVIGASCSYLVLTATGSSININTAVGIALQGALAGLAGLCVTVFVLALFKKSRIVRGLSRAPSAPQPRAGRHRNDRRTVIKSFKTKAKCAKLRA